jgi:arsenite methyltransferase
MMEANWSLPDVLIVDSKNDLNVYFTATEAKPSCCGTDAVKEEEEAPSCCSAKAKESCCEPEEKVSCCGTNSSSCACQDQTSSMAGEAKTLATRLGITDLNEWAGKDTGCLAS